MKLVFRHLTSFYYTSSSVPYAQYTDDNSWTSSQPDYLTSYYPDTTSYTWTTDSSYPDSSPTSTYYYLPASSPTGPPLTSTDPSTAVSWTTPTTESLTLSSISSAPSLSTASASPPPNSSVNRTAIIAAALAAGIVALLLLFLSGFVCYKRRQRQRREGAGNPRNQFRALPPDDDDGIVAPISLVPASTTPSTMIADNNTPATMVYRPASPILHSRISETGSIFREEVWPPPSPSVDPIQMRSSQVDLGRIVDDVMGPPSSVGHSGQPEWERMKRHGRHSSTTPLLMDLQTSFDSSEEDDLLGSTPVVEASSETFPTILPVAASAHELYRSSSFGSLTSSASHSNFQPASYRPPSAHGSVASSTFQRTQQPPKVKVSSPLVTALTGFGGPL